MSVINYNKQHYRLNKRQAAGHYRRKNKKLWKVI